MGEIARQTVRAAKRQLLALETLICAMNLAVAVVRQTCIAALALSLLNVRCGLGRIEAFSALCGRVAVPLLIECRYRTLVAEHHHAQLIHASDQRFSRPALQGLIINKGMG